MFHFPSSEKQNGFVCFTVLPKLRRRMFSLHRHAAMHFTELELHNTFTDEAQTALFTAPARTAL